MEHIFKNVLKINQFHDESLKSWIPPLYKIIRTEWCCLPQHSLSLIIAILWNAFWKVFPTKTNTQREGIDLVSLGSAWNTGLQGKVGSQAPLGGCSWQGGSSSLLLLHPMEPSESLPGGGREPRVSQGYWKEENSSRKGELAKTGLFLLCQQKCSSVGITIVTLNGTL